MSEKRIGLYSPIYSEEEWRILEAIARTENMTLRMWLNSEIKKLAKISDPKLILPEGISLPGKRQKHFYMPEHVIPNIDCLSDRLRITRPGLIKRFILDAALSKHYQTNGMPTELLAPSSVQ